MRSEYLRKGLAAEIGSAALEENIVDAITIIAEERIREAGEKGAFDNLPGAGKPLELEDDSHIPEDLRLAYKLLKNAGYVPEEVADRKEAQNIMDTLEHCTDEREKVAQMKKLDVVLARIASRRNGKCFLDDTNPYYDRVVARIRVYGNRDQSDSE